MKITQVAVNVWRVPVDRPYVAGGRTVDANWHVLARVTTSDGVEDVEYVPRSAGILRSMPRRERGELIAPDAPGLGLELDEAAVRRYQAA